MSTTSKQEAPAPKHTHYVSMENGAIYPALTSPSGYEDEHPAEYRPATQAEIEQYQRGNDSARPFEHATPQPVEIELPRTIQLATEELPAPSESPAPAPAVPPPPAFVVPPSAE